MVFVLYSPLGHELVEPAINIHICLWIAICTPFLLAAGHSRIPLSYWIRLASHTASLHSTWFHVITVFHFNVIGWRHGEIDKSISSKGRVWKDPRLSWLFGYTSAPTVLAIPGQKLASFSFTKSWGCRLCDPPFFGGSSLCCRITHGLIAGWAWIVLSHRFFNTAPTFRTMSDGGSDARGSRGHHQSEELAAISSNSLWSISAIYAWSFRPFSGRCPWIWHPTVIDSVILVSAYLS